MKCGLHLTRLLCGGFYEGFHRGSQGPFRFRVLGGGLKLGKREGRAGCRVEDFWVRG